MDLSLVVPVLNGRAFIAESVGRLRGFLATRVPASEIVVVDDGSTDGTAEALRPLEGEAVRVIRLESNAGKYGALKVGMAACCGRCRIFTDADVPYDLEALPFVSDLVNARGVHVVVGDRTLPESSYHERIPALRRVGTRAFSFFVTLLVTGGLFDTQCGLKGFRADVADALFPLLLDSGFSGDVELLYVALKYNLEIRRIPVRLRRAAPSTVRLGAHAVAMTRRIAALPWNWQHGRYESAALRAIASQAYWSSAG